jgi:hypothetical protein
MSEDFRKALGYGAVMGFLYLATHFSEVVGKLTGSSTPTNPPSLQSYLPAPTTQTPAYSPTYAPPTQSTTTVSLPPSTPPTWGVYNMLKQTTEDIAEENRRREKNRAYADTAWRKKQDNNEAIAKAEAARAASREADRIAAENRRLQREAADRAYELQRQNREAAERAYEARQRNKY